MKTFITVLLILPTLVFAQVGIGTIDPQATLDINGTLRVGEISENTSTQMIGADASGNIAEVGVGSNLSLDNGTLNATGTNKYLVQLVPIITFSSGQQFDDIDLDLNGANKDIVVFRLTGSTNNYEITGIRGGTDGKHIILLNVSSNNFRLSDNNTNSAPENRIVTFAGSFEATSGPGSAELVYDGISQRWIILNFRN